jgi:hypothetical protein
METYFVGKSFILNGVEAVCVGETDNGSLKLLIGKEEVWTHISEVKPVIAAAAA